MAAGSRYDDLHDYYHKIATTKPGNRYERLAALVFKALESRNTVIHDFFLRGDDSDVKHQIDVTVELPGKRAHRVLIECKDYDVSGKSAGLSIVRDFRSVIEDTKADQGIIITCTKFTQPARKYAKSKGIKLAILRKFEDPDMEGRIKTILVNLVIQTARVETAMVCFKEEEESDAFRRNLDSKKLGRPGIHHTDPVYFVKGTHREQFSSFLSRRVHEEKLWTMTMHGRLAMPADGWKLQVDDLAPVEFDGIIVNVSEEYEEEVLKITSDRVAELILSGFGDRDLVIFGDQLAAYYIDPESGVVLGSE